MCFPIEPILQRAVVGGRQSRMQGSNIIQGHGTLKPQMTSRQPGSSPSRPAPRMPPGSAPRCSIRAPPPPSEPAPPNQPTVRPGFRLPPIGMQSYLIGILNVKYGNE
jgi:hypothetical protein